MLWSAVFVLPFASMIYWTFYNSPAWFEFLYFPAVGLWLGVPEGILRKSWRLGLVETALIAGMLLVTSFFLDVADAGLGGIIVYPIVAFSAAGLFAGLGAKSLLASILGMISGSLGFYAVAYGLDWLDDAYSVLPSGDEVASAACVMVFALLMPVFFGIAVWGGLRFSQAKKVRKNQGP